MIQVKFKDVDNDIIHGGILMDNGSIICGCCGCIIESDEIGDGKSHEILKKYDSWVNLDHDIIDE